MSILRKGLKSILPYGVVHNIKHRRLCESAKGRAIEPALFNQYNEKMRVFYLQDAAAKYHYSFTAGREPRYIFWDRDNAKLPVHFYTHGEVFEPIGTPEKRFALLVEPETNIKECVQRLATTSVAEEFTRVFTHSEVLLDKLPNASLLLGYGGWYGGSPPTGGGVIDAERYQKKTKIVSMLCSAKNYLPGHKIRLDIASTACPLEKTSVHLLCLAY